MKTFLAAVGFAAAASTVHGTEVLANPLGKVLDLVGELEAKIIKEGEVEEKAYKEYVEWCDDTAANGGNAIKVAKKEKEKLEADIGEFTSQIEVASTKIEGLAGAISTAEAELKNASLIRDKELSDFKDNEKELMDTLDSMTRAIGVLEKELSKKTSLAQVDSSSLSTALSAIGTVLDAASFPVQDKNKLTEFIQAHDRANEEDAEFGAPAASVYESKSGGVMDVLEDMKDKAEGQLSDLRKAEVNAKHNFKMLEQSIKDQASADKKDMSEQKSGKAEAEESKAAATGDLEVVTKELSQSGEELEATKTSCMTVAADHEATIAGRKEELKVIGEAKKILSDTSGGAVSQTYSFAQVSRMTTRADLARSEAVTMVQKLSRKWHSSALAQLASKMTSVMRFAGTDPFGKIKGLITDMIEKLEREAGAEAEEKAYCDEQMAKTEEKKGELEDDIAKMTAKVDKAASKSAELKEQIKELQSELAALAKEQAEMDKIRQETHEDYVTAKKDLETGLNGVRKALTVLRDYYANDEAAAFVQDDSKMGAFMQQPPMPQKHAKAGGAGSSIIGILEVCESDFATNLAKEETQEADAQNTYDKMTQENKISKATKEQDEKYKTSESKSLDTTIAEISGDRETANTELTAVLEYYSKIKDRCIAKPETYEERKRRREAEIAGLKEALSVLSEEVALVQRKRRGSLRGVLTPS